MINLIKAKIVPPRLSGRLIQRELARLLAVKARDIDLLLICAPAGYGKTTLAVQYCRAAGAEICWYALDSLDNDAVVFGHYLIESLAQQIALSAELRVRAREGRFPNLTTLVHSLLQELEGTGDRVVLVLDDFHVVHNPAILAAVDLLLQYLPESMQLLMATRTKPTHLNRSALCSDSMMVVHAQDLSFNAEEMLKLFLSHGHDVKPSVAERLNEQVQGWVAGLKLIALGYREGVPIVAPPDMQTVGIYHYLFHEIYTQLSPELQDFLIKTSVSERFSRPLAQALTDRDDVDVLLHLLNRQQFFITQLCAEGEWVRYHPLLVDFLRRLLAEKGLAARMHLRAAQWWLSDGHLNEAANHFAASRDVEAICNFFHKYGPALFNDGHTHAMAQCLAVLPAEVIAEHLDLTLMAAWHENVVERRPDRVEILIRAVEAKRMQSMAPEEARRGVLAILGGLSAGITLVRHGPDAAAAQALEAMQLWAHDLASDKLASIYSELSNIDVERGRLEQALQWSLNAAEVDRLHSMHLGVFWHLYQQSVILAHMGDVPGAERRLDSAMLMARELGLGYLPLYDAWLRHRARLLWLRMQFNEAESAVVSAIEHCQRWPHEQLANTVWQCRLAQGRLDLGAIDLLARRVETLLNTSYATRQTASDAWDALMHAWMLQNDRESISRFLMLPLPTADSLSPSSLAMRRNHALGLLLLDRPREAAAHIEQQMQQAMAAGMILEYHHGCVVRVLIAWQLGESSVAHALLPPLLEWVARQHAPMLLLEYACGVEAPLAALLNSLAPTDAQYGLVSTLLQRVRQRLALQRKGRSVNLPDKLQTYGLTPQEWSIFRLVGQGRSNDDICDALNLSMNTVRCHIRNMNKKLGVRTRAEAIHLSLKLAQRELPVMK